MPSCITCAQIAACYPWGRRRPAALATTCWRPAIAVSRPPAPAEGLYLWRVHYPPVFGLPDDSDIMPPPTGCPGDLLE